MYMYMRAAHNAFHLYKLHISFSYKDSESYFGLMTCFSVPLQLIFVYELGNSKLVATS